MSLRDLLARGGAEGKADPEFLTPAQPFAWTLEDGGGQASPRPEDLNGRRVTQCALSRICGVCAEPLGRPVAFVGTEEEVARNAFHAPPLHTGCAEELAASGASRGEWRVVHTSGFEYVRPGRDEPDTRPTFQPNSLV